MRHYARWTVPAFSCELRSADEDYTYGEFSCPEAEPVPENLLSLLPKSRKSVHHEARVYPNSPAHLAQAPSHIRLFLARKYMHGSGIMICMRTTLIIDDVLLERARAATGIKEKTALVRAGLEALIAREAGKRLAALGGTQPKISDVPRRRSA
jgi:hypothetical protein